MDFGLYLRTFLSDRSVPLHKQVDDTVEICHVARDSGFVQVAVPQHWVSYPTVWPHPYPMLGRLAPEVGDMTLMTGILLVPLHHPVDVAEAVTTLDHIAKGRFVLGVGLGYRETELDAVYAERKDRGPRMEESIAMMKELWKGEEVTYEGKYWRIRGGRMAMPPYQQPHPPIWMACQSPGAIKRAARIADACYLGPQVGFDDLPRLMNVYWDERQAHHGDKGKVTLSRCIGFADSREKAIQEARDAAETTYRTYSNWDMQEQSMVSIHISSDSEITDWAVAGSADDCIERFQWLEEQGVEYVGVTFLNLPKDLEGRKEYVKKFAENVIQPMKKAAKA